jgi:hypothetical protein
LLLTAQYANSGILDTIETPENCGEQIRLEPRANKTTDKIASRCEVQKNRSRLARNSPVALRQLSFRLSRAARGRDAKKPTRKRDPSPVRIIRQGIDMLNALHSCPLWDLSTGRTLRLGNTTRAPAREMRYRSGAAPKRAIGGRSSLRTHSAVLSNCYNGDSVLGGRDDGWRFSNV